MPLPTDWTPTVTAPGLYPDLAADYHGKRHTPTKALSASGIKVLLNETPLDYITPREKQSADMAFGSIVHTLALGKGNKFSVSPFDDYRTKDARQWRDETIAEGLIPIKADKLAEAEQVAATIRAKIHHVLGGAEYETEVPFFWQEGDTWCSGMLDVWCPSLMVALDPKVTKNMGRQISGAIVRFGWDLQAAWYLRGLSAIFPERAGRIRFANILAKPEAPFTSRVVTINEAWRSTAETECLRALRIFDKCMATDTWPGYSDEIEMLDIPSWTLRERVEAEMASEDEA